MIGVRKQVAETLATSLATQGLNVLTGVLLARALEPDGRGALAIVLLWPFVLSSLVSLGLPDSLTYHCARRTESVSSLAGSALLISLAQAGVAAAATLIVLPPVVGEAVDDAAIWIAAGIVPFYLLAGNATAVLQALESMRWFNLVRLLVPLVTGSILIAFVAQNALSVSAAVVAYLGTYVLATVVAFGLVVRAVGRPSSSRSAAASLLRYGIRSHASFVATTMNERLDQLLIGIFLAPRALGLYIVAVALTSVTGIMGSSIAYVALPRIAAAAADDVRVAARSIAAFMKLAFVSLAIVTGPLVVFAPWLLRTAFGEAFGPAAEACRILLFAGVLLAFGRLLAALLKALGRPFDAARGDALGLAVTGVALAVLLPIAGITGAAVASLLAYGVTAAFMMRATARALGCRTSEFWSLRRQPWQRPLKGEQA